MTDPDDDQEASPASPVSSRGCRDEGFRPLLWVLLMSGMVGLLVLADDNMIGDAVFGLVTVACAAVLISQHRRNRRR